jgi:thymidylate synthase (FAD)
LHKSVVGFAVNEVSRRYVDEAPEFFIPDYWRKRAENIKQGSSEDQVYLSPMLDMETDSGCVHLPVELYEAAKECYLGLLKLGVCPEQARMVLPQAMYTEWIWTGSLFAWSRMYNLRTDSHTQLETQQIAFLIGEAIEPLFPKSWKALTK